MIIKVDSFAGQRPAVRPHLLPANAAQLAKNCRLVDGALAPLRGTTAEWTPTKSGTIQSIHLFGGYFWFHWGFPVDCIRGAVAGDTAERTYYTGEGAPRMTEAAIATVGGTNYPMASYTLGIPQPVATASVVVSGAAPDDPAELVSKIYVYTYVSFYGEEGPPSDPSTVIDVGPLQAGELSGMSNVPTGMDNIISKRIYVTNTGTYGTEFQFVTEIAVGLLAYSDSKKGDDLGEVMTSDDYFMPPADLAGLRQHPGNFLIGFSGKDLCMSAVGFPHAWPVGYRLAVDYPIVSVAVFGTSILVTTTGTPYLVTGGDPTTMFKEQMEVKQACVSARGMVDLGNLILYPSPDGLVAISMSQRGLITGKILTRDQWQALNPSSILATVHDGLYIGFYDTGTKQAGFIFDPVSGDFSELDLYATAVYQDLEHDRLYLVVAGEIVIWDSGAALTYLWRSREYRAPYPVNPGVGQVLSEAYPVTLRVYGDASLRATVAVADAETFVLPSGYLASRFYFEIEGAAEVTEIAISELINELASA